MNELIKKLRNLGISQDLLDRLSQLGDLSREQVSALEEELSRILLAHLDRAEADDVPTEEAEAELEAASVVAAAHRFVVAQKRSRPDLSSLASDLRAQLGEPKDDGKPKPTGRPDLARLSRRRPPDRVPRASTEAVVRPVLASGASIGDEPYALGRALVDAVRASAHDRPAKGSVRRIPVLRWDWTDAYAEDRRLGEDPSVNYARVSAVVSPAALVASGGVCGPATPSYEQMVLADARRPVRDALPSFDGSRGTVRHVAPPRIQDLDGGVTVHDNDADIAGTTKPCLRIECDDEIECTIHAVVRCFELGTFHQRTFPESAQAHAELAVSQQAREAEDQLWTLMCTGSTAVSVGQVAGAARDVVAGLDRAAAVFRSSHRMPESAPLRWLAPEWLRPLMRADLARQGPGDNTYAVTNEQLAAWFAVRGILPTFSPDATQAFPIQGAGALQAWPTTAETLLFPEGGWIYVDGGVLDVGLIRDSALAASNDVQIFSEVFETTCLVAPESWCLELDLCPDGSHAAGKDLEVCVIGS